MDPKKVTKALGPDEVTALQNVMSSLQEILQMSSGASADQGTAVQGQTVADAAVTPPAPVEDPKNPFEQKSCGGTLKQKALETTPSDAPTANDDVEARIDDVLPPETEDNIDEVAKAIAKLLGGRSVAKSAIKQVDPLTQVLEKIVTVQKSQAETTNEMMAAFSNLLDGMGITEQMNVAKSAIAKKSEPIMTQDNEAVVNVLKGLLGLADTKVEKESSNPGDNYNKVRKAFADKNILSALIQK